jgi:hypothetical protein
MKEYLLKKVLPLILLIFHIFQVTAQKHVKDQPKDILNSNIGLVITVPLTYPDYPKIQTKLISKQVNWGTI